jgi:hypothetical protein
MSPTFLLAGIAFLALCVRTGPIPRRTGNVFACSLRRDLVFLGLVVVLTLDLVDLRFAVERATIASGALEDELLEACADALSPVLIVELT